MNIGAADVEDPASFRVYAGGPGLGTGSNANGYNAASSRELRLACRGQYQRLDPPFRGAKVTVRRRKGNEGLAQMVRSNNNRSAYEWLLQLSAEGWAWEFLRRNPDYRRDYVAFSQVESDLASSAALRWGLLKFEDPDIDAREAIVFWSPKHCRSVLSVVAAGDLPDCPSGGECRMAGVKCRISVFEASGSSHRHVLYSCEGLFLQLAIAGANYGDLSRVKLLVEAFPQRGGDHRLLALRRLADLFQHRRMRRQLYARQRRGPRLSHIVQILDAHAKSPRHRATAREVFGEEKADGEWDNLRDHVRRAVAAGRKLTQSGYLDFLN
jgi:hypothetical protein